MKISSFAIIKRAMPAVLALIAIIFTAIPALAATAVATTPVNVRSGPGTNYRVVDVLARGEEVEVIECQARWCRIRHPGPDGWVSARYLSGVSGDGTPEFSFQFGIGPEGPSFGFFFGQPPGIARVCFYDRFNYRGASFCLPEGTQRRQLTGFWNNRISSVRIFGDTDVTLCRNWYFGGYCRTLTRSERALGGFLNNQVSSVKLY